MNYKEIYSEIKKFKKIYIARHIGPDPDAFGSQMALKESIQITFPNKDVYAIGTTVARFKYFGKIDKVSLDYENGLLIVTDTPDFKRIDMDNATQFKHIIKIDHHPIIDTFGKYDYVDEDASSASELVLGLLNNTRLKMNENIASILYMGIVSDTNRFLFTTSYKTLEIASELVKKYKLDLDSLYRKMYSKPLSEIRLMGHIASTMKVDKYGLAYIEIDEDILTSLGADNAAASNMINDFNNIKEVLVWVFNTYDNKSKIYRVNIRSRGPVINEIATSFGGGGHKYASGVRTESKEVVDNLIKELRKCCEEFKEGED